MSLETSDNQKDLGSSVGLVKPQKVVIEQPLKLACGVTLPSHTLAYETYGTPNKDNTNAILICHALITLVAVLVVQGQPLTTLKLANLLALTSPH
jgi:homoserine acetyltransferase